MDESRLGSVTIGKEADLTVVDKDLWKMQPREVLDVAIRMTIVGGQIEYER